MAKSIICDEGFCIVCKKPREAMHHVFGGPNRKNSEHYGLKVPLCNEHHNMSDWSVHLNREMDLEIKKLAQIAFEDRYTHEKFMEVFGKNYL